MKQKEQGVCQHEGERIFPYPHLTCVASVDDCVRQQAGTATDGERYASFFCVCSKQQEEQIIRRRKIRLFLFVSKLKTQTTSYNLLLTEKGT